MMHARYLAVAGFSFGLLLGCSKKVEPAPAAAETPPAPTPAAPAPPPDPAAEAKTLFHAKCVVCHGEAGHGDGPGAAALTPKPRDFTDAAWQQASNDEALRKVILEGGPAVGKSPGMPPNPDLKDQEAVVTELVKLVRAFVPSK